MVYDQNGPVQWSGICPVIRRVPMEGQARPTRINSSAGGRRLLGPDRPLLA
jgi:hypothetical protein